MIYLALNVTLDKAILFSKKKRVVLAIHESDVCVKSQLFMVVGPT